jgi:cation diffusion facilitator family transporter
MRTGEEQQLPRAQQAALARAKRLSWITIAYLLSVVVILALVMGQSQAMKTAWVDDLFSLVPSIVFLIGNRVSRWEPTERFPFGFHRAATASYLAASVALLTVGVYLLIEAVLKLVFAEHPTIGGIDLFGYDVWLGWPMIAALLYSGVPPVFMGRAKLPLAKTLYDKVLHASAKMDRADWMVAAAAIVGILGVGLGFWWMDAGAAMFISLEIIHDGYSHLRLATFDILDHWPRTVEGGGPDPAIERITHAVRDLDWVREAEVRLRTSGRTLSCEAFVVPVSDERLTERIEEAMRNVRRTDWRLHHFTVTPVTNLDSLAEEDGPA